MAVTSKPCVAIRRHRFPKVFLDDLLRLGSIDLALREFLSAAAAARTSSCAAASTRQDFTLLRAMLNEVRPESGSSPSRTTGARPRPLPRPPPRRGGAGGPEENVEGEGEIDLATLVRWGCA
jgi:Flp pilus assembly CpaF family ATPase